MMKVTGIVSLMSLTMMALVVNQRESLLLSDNFLSMAMSELKAGKNSTAICVNLFLNHGMEPLQSNKNNDRGGWIRNKCDDLFCRSSTPTNDDDGRVCHWSAFAIDLLLEDATERCDRNASHVKDFLMDPQWNIYRYAGYINGIRGGTFKDIPHTFPDSIIGQMDPNTTLSAEDEASRVIAQRLIQLPTDQKLPPGTLVVHLRLGDVVEGHRVLSVRDLLMEQQYFMRRRDNDTQREAPCQPWNQICLYNPPLTMKDNPWFNVYVMPLSYYSSLLPDNLHQFHNVVILGAAHQGQYQEFQPGQSAIKSCHYTTAIHNYFQRRMPWARVSLQLGQFIDDDILTAAQADRFFRGGGSFSEQLQNIQQRFHVPPSLSSSCSASSLLDKEEGPTNNKEVSTRKRECKDLFMNQGIEPLSTTSKSTTAWMGNQCDNLFCRNITTISDHDDNGEVCQWSGFAIDALLQDANDVCDPKHLEDFYYDDPTWKDYYASFFDFLGNITRRGINLNDIPKKFPNSIWGAMVDDSHTTSNRDDNNRAEEANRVIAERLAAQLPTATKEEGHTLVIHLNHLGEVLDGSQLDSPKVLLMEARYFHRQRENGTNVPCEPWNKICMYNQPLEVPYSQLVKPLSYYSSFLDSSDEDISQFQSVVIMGTAHIGRYKRIAIKSCHYTTAIRNYFQRRMPHATVSLQLGRFPDEDILTAAQATQFIKGGGDFSTGLERIHKAFLEDRQQQQSSSKK